MMHPWTLALLSVIGVSLISLIGAFSIVLKDAKLHRFLKYFVSFSAGALLGDVFIHLLPEVVEEAGFTPSISFYILLGIVATFIVEKIVHWHHQHSEDCEDKKHPITFMTLFGDGIHNFIDGLVIGSSYLVSPAVGVATTLAVVLHEIPQEIGNFGVLLHGGYSKTKALLLNLLTAVTAIVGTIVALMLGNQMSGSVVFLSAFAAGNFIYIAGSDLIPDMHREMGVKKSVLQFATLLLGIGVMMLLTFLE